MIIEIDRDLFLKSINIAESIISGKSINSVINNCLLKIYKEYIEIVSTDNEIAIRTTVDAVADQEMEIAINGKKIAETVSSFPKGIVILEISDDYVINISSKKINRTSKLVGFSSEDFPEIPIFPEDSSFEIKQASLKNIIKKVVYAAAKDNIKPVFNGLYIDRDQEYTLTAVATDSKRLALITEEVDCDLILDEGIIIPLKTVDLINKTTENEGNCLFTIKQNQCFFKINKTDIISRIVEGQFPSYKAVVPKEFISNLLVDKATLTEALNGAKFITDEHASRKIILKVNQDNLTIETSFPGIGEFSEQINYEGNIAEEIAIGINADYLKDALKEVSSLSVNIGITGQMSPVTVCPEDNDQHINVIMPIQIKNSDE